ncbi:alpha/beta hydrolase [Paenibacillus oryzisoli]|uniref:alpha/beta fold hydrolase n=1 Tax=Paenibacillus oryzisoli TaxID=1850517 RepID=UPI003D281687
MLSYVDVNGTKLHVEITGPADGEPIVFIPPPLLTLETFRYQKEGLSDRFRVITFDVRGHGESDCTSQPLTYALIAQDITELLDALGIEQAYLCGYSTGGSVVLEALLTYSSRFLGGIVVSGMSQLTDRYNRMRVQLALRLAKPSGWMKLLTGAITYGNSDKPATYQLLSRRASEDATANVRSYFEQSLLYNCTDRLSFIQQPMLLIYGQEDPVFYQYGELLNEKLPRSSLYYLKGAKHPIPLQSPDKMNELIRLWIPSLADQETARTKLDLAIAQQMNPAMYGEPAPPAELSSLYAHE